MANRTKARNARVPKLNIIEAAGIAMTAIGTLGLMFTAIFSAPIPLGAVAIGLGLLGMAAFEFDMITEQGITESLLVNLAMASLFIGVLAVIQGVGIQIGLMKAADTNINNALFSSGGFMLAGLAITGLGSILKEG